MRRFIAITSATLVAVAAVLLASWYFKRLNPEVTDSGESEQQVERMNQERLEKLTEAEIRELVEAYVKTQHQSPEYWTVGALKERAVPHLIEVLKRPESFVKPDPKGTLDDAPAQRALEMLRMQRGYPQDALISLLLPFADSKEKWQRQEAARCLSASGKASVKDVVVQLLADPEDYVRSSAVTGLLHANRTKRADPELLSAAFEPLKSMTTTQNDKAMAATDAAQLLLLIDRTRAADFLTGPAVMSSTNSNLARLLAQLTGEQVAVPAPLLLGFVEGFTAGKDDRKSAAYGEALKNLALQKHAEAGSLIQQALAEVPAPPREKRPFSFWPSFERRRCAAQALCILNDMPDAVKTAASNEESAGFKGLPLPQQRVLLVVRVDSDVSNGGFSQYFFNSSDSSQEVAAALDDIGASGCARAFRDAVSVFGRRGPSQDDKTRHRQLEKLSARDAEALDKADTRWFAEHHDISALLYLYAFNHRTNFVRFNR